MSAWPYKLAKGDPRHGTKNGYGNLGCRCASCRAAATLYMREQRERGVGMGVCECGARIDAHAKTCRTCYVAAVATTHGKEKMYVNGCRCDACRAASAAGRRARRHANPEATLSYERSRRRVAA